jgi:RND superfamily putative drug exporter
VGARSLEEGLSRPATGAERLAAGAGSLGSGGEELQAGLARLASGAWTLAGALQEGQAESAPLETGLDQASATTRGRVRGLRRSSERFGRSSDQAQQLFSSGHAPLAAFDRASGPRRESVEQAISLDSGGRAARFVVVPSSGPNDPRTAALLDRVRATVPDLERAAGVDAGVLGTGSELAEFERVVSARLPLIIVALSLSTWLVLIVLFRSVLLPLVAVLLNLVTVGASFGVLALALELPGSPLGDAGFIDAISAVAIFVIVFGLSIDYEVFLLSRMREGWLRERDTEAAIDYGVRRTAGVIVGAAAIMTGVFTAFALSDVANLRQMGLGLAVAVMLDATVIRLFVLPAVMRRLGDRNWWLPGWLDRRLPQFSAH